MKNLLSGLLLCLSLFTATNVSAAQFPVALCTNNSGCDIYVSFWARDANAIMYQSDIILLPAGTSNFCLFANVSCGTNTPVTWPGGTPTTWSSPIFYGVEFYEYDPTSACTNGTAIPGSACGFVNAYMDLISGGACMETSGSTCSTCTGNTIINGSIYAHTSGSITVDF